MTKQFLRLCIHWDDGMGTGEALEQSAESKQSSGHWWTFLAPQAPLKKPSVRTRTSAFFYSGCIKYSNSTTLQRIQCQWPTFSINNGVRWDVLTIFLTVQCRYMADTETQNTDACVVLHREMRCWRDVLQLYFYSVGTKHTSGYLHLIHTIKDIRIRTLKSFGTQVLWRMWNTSLVTWLPMHT